MAYSQIFFEIAGDNPNLMPCKMDQNSEKMSANKSSIIERRSGKDRRRIFDHGHFFFGRAARKNLLEQRSQAERRAGWIRVNKWSSVYLSDLKIAKFLK